MPNSDSYFWIGANGTWDTATNWFDLTTGTAATVPPGINNPVTIQGGPTVSGSGSSASLTLGPSDEIIGDLNTGTLVVIPTGLSYIVPFGTAYIGTGGTINAGTALIGGGLVVSGSLVVDDILQLSTAGIGDAGIAGALLAVVDGGRVQTSNLVIPADYAGAITVDPASVFEVGSAGTGVAGALTIDQGATVSPGVSLDSIGAQINANVVDNGLIDAAGLTLQSGTLSGTGTVTAAPGGYITVADSVTSAGLLFQLNGNATLFAETAFTTGNIIAMSGSANVLNLAPAAFMNAATLTGFNTTDTLAVDAVVTGDIYAPGTLTLLNGNSIVAVVNVAGDYTDQSFQAVQQSPSLSVISAIPGSGAPSGGTATQDSYVWIGPANGFWQVASNWEDVTAGQNPAVVAPGSLDIVTIGGSVTVNGIGSAASLNILGTVSVTGDLSIGTLIAGTSDTLDINTGGTVSAAIVSDAGSIIVNGASAELLVSGTLGIDQTMLTVSDGGVVQAGSVDLQGTSPDTGFNVADTLSTVEVGNAGTAAAGTLTIDAGQTVSGTGGLSQPDTGPEHNVFGPPAPAGYPVVNNGLIIGNGLQIGAIYSIETLESVRDSRGVPFTAEYFIAVTAGSLTGTGTVDVETGGTINVLVPVAGSETFRLDGSADANFYNTLSSGNVVLMDGGSNTVTIGTTFDGIEIGGAYNDVGLQGLVNSNTTLPDWAGTIYGFSASDTIDLQGHSFTGDFYRNGVLNLLSGTNTEYSIAIGGDYTDDVFEVSGSIVTLSPGRTDGTSTGQTFSWIGPSDSVWGSSSNWADITTGQSPAVTVPGSLDVVSIDDAFIFGNGDAAGVTFTGSNTLVGDFQFGTADVTDQANLTISNADVEVAGALQTSGTLNVSNGATLQLSALELDGVNGGNSNLTVNNADLNVAGALLTTVAVTVLSGATLQTGTLEISAGSNFGYGGQVNAYDHAAVQTSVLELEGGAINEDATSSIEVGNLGSATAGALTIDPGSTISGSGFLNESIIDNGLIAGTELSISASPLNVDALSGGTGTVEVLTSGVVTIGEAVAPAGLTFQLDGSSELSINATIGVGNAVDLIGNGNTVSISIPFVLGLPAIGAVIDGFNNTDTLIVMGTTVVGATWADGTLSLSDGTTTVSTLNLAGNYTDEIFSIAPTNASDEEQVTMSIACFAAGTRIATPRGEIPVEFLSSGDEVTLVSGDTAPIVWIGRRRIDCRAHPTPRHVWPVRIRHSAFAPGIPCRDLFLSPDHAVFAEDVLIPIKYLTNGDTIHQAPCDTVEYFHLELPSHDLVLADGMAVESYLDTGDRSSFENAGRVIKLFPEFSSLKWEAYGYAPLVVTGPPVEAARRRIETQARSQDSAPRRRKRRKA